MGGPERLYLEEFSVPHSFVEAPFTRSSRLGCGAPNAAKVVAARRRLALGRECSVQVHLSKQQPSPQAY